MQPEPKIESNFRQAVPMFAVSDMQASLSFYVDGLGFEVTHKWIDDGKLRWCWLEIGEAALMLQEFKKEGHDSWVPQGKVGEGVSINFQCLDALAIYREFRSRSVPVTKPFVGNAMWVTSVTDPDGYNLFFESPTDAPEESEYVENER